MKRLLLLLLLGCLAGGCTNTEVQPIAASTSALKLVYIQRNPAADDIAADLESTIENGLQRHGIGTKVITGEPPNENDYVLTYAATNGWDIKPFMKTAELRLKRGTRQIGFVLYENKGGFNTSKYGTAREKLNPLLDQLLSNYR